MHTRPTKAWALLGIVAGCAVYTSGIRPDASLDPGSAYLYGRFFMKATANEAEFGGKQSIGLVIRCGASGRRPAPDPSAGAKAR
jgi:hypothetical protein